MAPDGICLGGEVLESWQLRVETQRGSLALELGAVVPAAAAAAAAVVLEEENGIENPLLCVMRTEVVDGPP